VFISGTQMWERKTNERLKQLYRKKTIRLVQFKREAREKWTARYDWKVDNNKVKTEFVININTKN